MLCRRGMVDCSGYRAGACAPHKEGWRRCKARRNLWERLAWLVPHFGCEGWGTLSNASVPPQLDPPPPPNPRCFSFFSPCLSHLSPAFPGPDPVLVLLYVLPNVPASLFLLPPVRAFASEVFSFSCLCALADSSFSSPSVLSSLSRLSQLTSSGERHLCRHLHLKSQWLSLGNSCPAASDTELTSLSPHTEHVPAGSSNEVISLHTQWSTLQLVESPSY